MPLSYLLFRRKPDAANTNRPPQQTMHRPPPPPPPPPPLLAAAAVARKPLLGLKAVTGAHVPGENQHHCIKRSSAFSSSPSASACSSVSSSMSASSYTGSDLSSSIFHREDLEDLDEEDNNQEVEVEDEDEDEGDAEEEDERCCWATYGKRCGARRLPPPITVVAKAGERRCLMPWVLRRSYEDGGRLVMREVKVDHQEYLKPCRAGGRLTLKLVHLHEPEPPAASPHLPARPQAKVPTAPVPVPAPTHQHHHREVFPTLAMQWPSTFLLPENETSTENPPRAARREVWSRGAPRFALPSMAMLASSLPEVGTKGCYVNARAGCSLFGVMAAARTPPVHS